MKSASKDRIKLMILLIAFLLGLSAIGYMIFGKPEIAGEYIPNIRIVKAENTMEIELNKKYKQPYAIKVQQNNKYYLKYYDFEENDVPYECKYELTSDQYSKIEEGNTYWFNIKFLKLGDKTNGTVKKVYTDNPRK